MNDKTTVFLSFSFPIYSTGTGLALISLCNEFAKTNSNTTALPRLAKVPDALALRVKNVWTAKQSSLLRTFDNLQKFVLHWKQPAIFVLADLWPQPDYFPSQVNVSPLQRSHFTKTPARQVKKRHRVFQVIRQCFSDLEKVSIIKEALPCVVLFKKRDIRFRGEFSCLYSKRVSCFASRVQRRS